MADSSLTTLTYREKKMITAKEAREISGPSIDDQVKAATDELSSMIKEAAENKRHSITIRKKPYALWAYNKNNQGIVTLLL